MNRSVAEAIRQQSEDLREELKELEQWEDAVEAKEAAKAQRKITQSAEAAAIVPPIRGTVPSLKEAVRQQQQSANSSSGSAAKTAADPIQEAKERGNAFFQAGRLQEAVAAYTVGIDLDPASSTTHVLYANRAMCYLKLGQWSAAEKDATTCVQMNTAYAKAYYRRAMARKNLHKLKEARADLEAVLALVPKDVSAQQEMAEVTKALQAERAAAAATPAPVSGAAKKRIVIEEVDSEDDEADADAAAPLAAAATTTISAEEQQMRQARIDEDLKNLASARALHESQTRLDAQREAQAQEQRQRRNQRVEIIEEEDEIEEDARKEPQVHPPPPLPSQSTASASTPSEAPLAQAEEAATPAPSASSSSPDPAVLSVAPRPRPAVSKDSLTAPKSFTEFERRFREVEQEPELRNYYVNLLSPAGLSKLFGSNMTPEMLLGILESIKTFNGAVALQFAKGLCQVSRVEDMTLFFSSKEKAVVQEVLDLLKSSGAPAKDIQTIQRKLKPF